VTGLFDTNTTRIFVLLNSNQNKRKSNNYRLNIELSSFNRWSWRWGKGIILWFLYILSESKLIFWRWFISLELKKYKNVSFATKQDLQIVSIHVVFAVEQSYFYFTHVRKPKPQNLFKGWRNYVIGNISPQICNNSWIAGCVVRASIQRRAAHPTTLPCFNT
jgi:hypothetical protein